MGSARTAFRRHASFASALVLLLGAACGGGGNDEPSAPTGPTGTGLAIVAGNFQLAQYGTSVTIAPAVKVTKEGSPVAGAQVVFAPVNGSVTGGSTITDANGVATVGSWTLSAAPGVNTLKATSGTLTVSISATAIPGPAAAVNIKAGNNQNGVELGPVLIPIQVEVTDGTYPIRGAQVDFTVVSGGGTLDVPNQTTNVDGVATLGGWKLGAVGVNTVRASVRNTSLTATFTANAAPLQVTALSPVRGNNQSGFLGNLASERATVEVRDQFGNPVVGVAVQFAIAGGGGSIVKPIDTTGTNGQAEIGTWRYGSSASQSVTASVPSFPAVPAVTFTANLAPVPASAFKIDVRYPDGEPSAQVKAAFTAAAAKWSAVVVGDLEDIVLSGTNSMGPDSVNGNLCIPPTTNQTIDDVVIFAFVKPIDGAGGILGFATPYWTRSSDMTTIAGCMTFDEADLAALAADGLLQATITHEMGHVLGIGTLWRQKNLTVGTCDPNTGAGSTRPYFIGGSARQAFRSVLGAGVAWTDSMVPLEGSGTCFNGTRDGHPSEEIFKNELMTGYIDPVANPLSVVSATFLRDLGMTVNDLAVDAYTLPYGLPALRMTAASGTKLNEMHVNPPIHVMDRNGNTTAIIDR